MAQKGKEKGLADYGTTSIYSQLNPVKSTTLKLRKTNLKNEVTSSLLPAPTRPGRCQPNETSWSKFSRSESLEQCSGYADVRNGSPKEPGSSSNQKTLTGLTTQAKAKILLSPPVTNVVRVKGPAPKENRKLPKTIAQNSFGQGASRSRIVALSFCEPRSCRLQLSS